MSNSLLMEICLPSSFALSQQHPGDMHTDNMHMNTCVKGESTAFYC